MNKEINVYVVELNQPWENWYGLLVSYDFINNTCIVENDKEEHIQVRMNEVYEADSNENIELYLLTQLHKDRVIAFLKKSGLSSEESEIFYTLAKKIKPPSTEIEAFYKKMEQGIPFEGGMGTTEAIVGLTESL